MNYPQTLVKAKTLLQQKHHAQAVRTAASVPGNLLVDIRNRAVHEGHEPDPAEAAYKVEAE